MLKRRILFSFTVLAVALMSACKKDTPATQICLHDSSVDYLKRWGYSEVITDVHDAEGKTTSHTVIRPNGYFQINADFTYNIFSDDAPINGKWNINKNCEFVLNPNTGKERRYSVIKLSDDSLTLRQTNGRTVITQKYKAFKCPTLASLQARWDLHYTLQSPYGIDTVYKTEKVMQQAYLRLYPGASYNVVFFSPAGTTPPQPITGTWGIQQTGCLMVLDKNKTNERSYEVQKVNNDSLVIWRKDTVSKLNLLRYYAKHK